MIIKIFRLRIFFILAVVGAGILLFGLFMDPALVWPKIYQGETKGDSLCSALAVSKASIVSQIHDVLCKEPMGGVLQQTMQDSNLSFMEARLSPQNRVVATFSQKPVASRLTQTIRHIVAFPRAAKNFLHEILWPIELVAINPDKVIFSYISRDFAKNFLLWKQTLTPTLLGQKFDEFISRMETQFRFSFLDILPHLTRLQLVAYQENTPNSSVSPPMALIVQNNDQGRLEVLAQMIEKASGYVLASLYPQEAIRILPDQTKTTELLFNPSRFQFFDEEEGGLPIRLLQFASDNNARIELILAFQKHRLIFSTSRFALRQTLKEDPVPRTFKEFMAACQPLTGPLYQDMAFMAVPKGGWALLFGEPNNNFYGCAAGEGWAGEKIQ